MTHWSAGYVGIPWVARGRDEGGLDCYGLVRLVYADRCGVLLPDYGGYVTARERREIDALIGGAIGIGDWLQVDRRAARTLDVAVFATGGLATHLGVMIDARRMLHVAERRDAEISRIDAGQWAQRLVGIFRPA